LRVDTAGASHELLDWCHKGRIRYSVGYDLTDTVRAAILEITDGGLGPRAGPGRIGTLEWAGRRDHQPP
jgi:hypothetical protein